MLAILMSGRALRTSAFVILLLVGAAGCQGDESTSLMDGDIIFQTTKSSQSEAIQRATHSKYSHVGLVFVRNGHPEVLETVSPAARYTPVAEWTARGEGGHYVVKRLCDAESTLTATAKQQLRAAAEAHMGKAYDSYFQWSDDTMYCSELVWKSYRRALGLALGDTQKLREFNIGHPVVRAKLRERFGDNPPLDETVISPAAIFESDLLVTVRSN